MYHVLTTREVFLASLYACSMMSSSSRVALSYLREIWREKSGKCQHDNRNWTTIKVNEKTRKKMEKIREKSKNDLCQFDDLPFQTLWATSMQKDFLILYLILLKEIIGYNKHLPTMSFLSLNSYVYIYLSHPSYEPRTYCTLNANPTIQLQIVTTKITKLVLVYLSVFTVPVLEMNLCFLLIECSLKWMVHELSLK